MARFGLTKGKNFMEKRRFTLCASLILVLGLNGLHAQEKQSLKFAWPEEKKAAVCLTYDDGLDCHLDVAAPALERHGFRGTFYVTGNSPSLNSRTGDWRAMAARGHELGNHTLFHPCHGSTYDWVKPEYDLDSYTLERLMSELFTANSLLKAVDGREERSFAYTCTNHTIKGISFVDDIRTLFPSARGGGEMPVTMDQVDPHYVPSWGVVDPTGEELIQYVEQALEQGTMAVIMFHSVGGGYLNVSSEAHEQLLSYLEEHSDILWVDTFQNVLKHVNSELLSVQALTE
jgi:peptidoglycan/xylan/chitin deacetylase (PgdA/CDA1 family)